LGQSRDAASDYIPRGRISFANYILSSNCDRRCSQLLTAVADLYSAVWQTDGVKSPIRLKLPRQDPFHRDSRIADRDPRNLYHWFQNSVRGLCASAGLDTGHTKRRTYKVYDRGGAVDISCQDGGIDLVSYPMSYSALCVGIGYESSKIKGSRNDVSGYLTLISPVIDVMKEAQPAPSAMQSRTMCYLSNCRK
jgi:hypothetical protein